ncbi:hypothetical protein MWU54_14235 [Marivita sp. S6314]|uniref:hypothetical protein n=1 Tax=Marivita sp. S6314 TaxID=2926406 RepID=UPI001FF61704|nr:hypothetical protein [Marivita sp. S6314]MCK0151195.1 hypothetical protein [Marivita sp. S6314]
MTRTCVAAALLTLGTATASLADLHVSFRDGAPKDTFRIVNNSGCATGPMTLSIDMTPSAGQLIFDVTSAGAGVEVFQPLEVTKGADFLNGRPDVLDGQKTLDLNIANLPGGAEIAFTIDVDDTMGAQEITVNGSEMSGSTVAATLAAMRVDATFDASAIAKIATPACTS